MSAALTDRITMGMAEPLEVTLGETTANAVRFLRTIPGIEGIFAGILVIFVIVVIKIIVSKRRKS